MPVFPTDPVEQFPYGAACKGTLRHQVLRGDPVDLEIVAGAVAVNLTLSSQLRLALTADVTIGAPSGAYEGVHGKIVVTQDATGGRDVSWNAAWDWGPEGKPDFTNDAAGAVTIVEYEVVAEATVLVTAIRGTGTSAQDEAVEDLTVGSINSVQILSGTVDPTAGVGIPHTSLLALYFRNNGGTVTLWHSTAAGDTAWVAVDPLD